MISLFDIEIIMSPYPAYYYSKIKISSKGSRHAFISYVNRIYCFSHGVILYASGYINMIGNNAIHSFDY